MVISQLNKTTLLFYESSEPIQSRVFENWSQLPKILIFARNVGTHTFQHQIPINVIIKMIVLVWINEIQSQKCVNPVFTQL